MIRECSAEVAAAGGASGMYSVPSSAQRVNVRGGPFPEAEPRNSAILNITSWR